MPGFYCVLLRNDGYAKILLTITTGQKRGSAKAQVRELPYKGLVFPAAEIFA